MQPPSSPSACLYLSFTFSPPNFPCSSLIKPLPQLFSRSLLVPALTLSVGCWRGLWNADSGTLGSLHGPAQCITPAPQDAVIHLTPPPSIRHFESSLHLCLSALASVDTPAVTPLTHLFTSHRLWSSQCFYIHHYSSFVKCFFFVNGRVFLFHLFSCSSTQESEFKVSKVFFTSLAFTVTGDVICANVSLWVVK